MTGTSVADHRSLPDQLRALGMPHGAPVLVHCSIRALGPPGLPPATLFGALSGVLGSSATLVVPTHTANNSTTSPAFRAATRGMTDDQISAYVAGMPGFDRDHSPSYQVGRFAEWVRRRPDAVRSAHPQTSFAAVGPQAPNLMAVHDLDCHLGERSPLGALYAADAWVILLGVGYRACTGFHLAEYRLSPPMATREYECFVQVNGARVHRRFSDVDFIDRDFEALGSAMATEQFVASGPVGHTTARAFPLQRAVEFAIGWMNIYRQR